MPTEMEKGISAIPISVDLQIRKAKYKLKINWDPRLKKISRNKEQGQTPLQRSEINCPEHFYIRILYIEGHVAKNHLLKLTIMSITPIVRVCCNGLWPMVDMQGKEVACLARIKQFLSNNKSIPSLPPSLHSKEIKKMTVRKASLQEKRNVSNMQ